MKRFYVVRVMQWDSETKDFTVLNTAPVYESKAAAMAEFERFRVTAATPKIQVWEQLCKNDGFVQAQRRIAKKEL